MKETLKRLGMLGIVTAVSISLMGCGETSSNPATTPVTGKITQNGQPVEGAMLVFVPMDGKASSASAISGADGTYKATTFVAGDGITPGQFKVRATNYEKPKVDPSKMGSVTYEEEQKQYDPNAKPAPPPKNLFPKKYESEHTSGLKLEVGSAPVTFDIDIAK